jgi:uncharacterized DUF497 family protein
MAGFIWTDWNVEHIAEHGITTGDAEYVVLNARPPFPRQHGDDKWLVRGQTQSGQYVQVIFVFEADAHFDYADVDLTTYDADADDNVYVIHARPLEADEIRNFRR